MLARLRSGSNVGMFCTVPAIVILIFLGRRARGRRTGMALCTAVFAQCACQGFTNCRFWMVFLLSGWPKMLEPTGNVQARYLIFALSSVRARCFFPLLPDLCSMWVCDLITALLSELFDVLSMPWQTAFFACRSHCYQAPARCHTRWKRRSRITITKIPFSAWEFFFLYIFLSMCKETSNTVEKISSPARSAQ